MTIRLDKLVLGRLPFSYKAVRDCDHNSDRTKTHRGKKRTTT